MAEQFFPPGTDEQALRAGANHFIESQGPKHSLTPEAGAFDGQRPMIIMHTDPPGNPLANNPWPVASAGLNPGTVAPPSPADWPMSQIVLVPGPIMKRYS